jgi:cytochrome oxidase Cu insertion factor (SCO1/SenC/PrrC family)
MFFGYTFCPDACPTALNNISAALEGLGPDADKLQPLFITAKWSMFSSATPQPESRV